MSWREEVKVVVSGDRPRGDLVVSEVADRLEERASRLPRKHRDLGDRRRPYF